ncbi:cupredoxin domain-containing protein [Rivularia sp. UHCC 0363]|uniref:cupredoxin domain-containing protein n=1 Tax=Rivularia sp. UHCC 0363 TaxID=3110244 RepID=UPI002B1ED1CF|nr:cupredoxin domain-containing protein [Rivularia sp. UHCC 0363]MEA5595744.1 cupredoxin domain-containing protein [Rivularia sp. UHCC 0363]
MSCYLMWMLPANATSIKPSVKEIQVSLGSSTSELKFFPEKIEFIAGQKYKLILDNPSPEKHYFTSKDFADASWTQNVQAGKVEVKGAIHEVELKPGGKADWVLIPLKSGTYELHCSIKGHAEAGMRGEIVVSNS